MFNLLWWIFFAFGGSLSWRRFLEFLLCCGVALGLLAVDDAVDGAAAGAATAAATTVGTP
ncbi:hypothetical protein OH492_04110 [Vibrio chagasii]|nr:hypothetical protein [Vibrio chagasii]